MLKKASLILAGLTALAVFTRAQSIHQNLEQLAKDPKTKENAAKADVYLHRHTIMNDSLQPPTTNAAAAVHQKKKQKAKGRQ